jgi:hypothetical protein
LADAATGQRRWLARAILLFALVKLAWVFVAPLAMGLPRLGDDALVYLWTGVSTVAESRLEQPAIRDIVQLRQDDANAPAALDAARARVAMRTTGVSASPVAFLTGAFLHAGAGHELAFALLEAAIGLWLCAGIAYCLAQLVGRGAAAGSLALLAFAILPNQGLHYLVPSVFVLATALVLWATVLKHPARWPLVLLLALAMLLTHPIGPVYLLVAVALVLGQVLLDRHVTAARAASLGALVAAVPLWLAINAATGVRAPMTTGLGGLSFTAVPANIAGVAGHLKTLILTQPALFALLLIGLGVAARQRRANPDAFLLAGVLTGVVLTTVIVDVPGYPGELPSRALIGLVIVCTGIAAAWGLEASRAMRRRGLWIAGAIGLAWATQLPLFASYGIGNINSRHQIYGGKALRAEISQLPSDAAIVWLDTDVALMAGLLEGADRLRAVPYPMLANPAELRARTAGASAVFLATTPPERLNGMALLRSWSLRPRFYGWGFDQYRNIVLDAAGAAGLPQFLRVEGGDVRALRLTAANGVRCSIQAAAGADAGWYALTGCADQQQLRLESSNPRLRLTGLALRSPAPACAWPWGEAGLHVTAEPRRGGEHSVLPFSYAYLLGESTARAVQSQLGPLSVSSCRSGLIWLQAGATTAKP